jgi:thiol-disulfide isomerase/thioredoxin
MNRPRRLMMRRRIRRRFNMSSIDANPFRMNTGRSLKMLSTLQGQRKDNPNSGMLVWIYADWCGHCRSFLPTWRSLVKKFPEIDFVTINGDSPSFSSESPSYYPVVQGYPTIWVFSPESETPVVYRGDRSVRSLEKVIRDM